MKSRILLVEDAPEVQSAVTTLLRGDGHEVIGSGTGEEGLRLASEQAFDVLILDVILPGLNGYDLCRTVRARGYDGGIMMLTGCNRVDDRVRGLLAGADDYVTKPFDGEELLARLTALLRRLARVSLPRVQRYRFGDVSVDSARREVWRGCAQVTLATKEFELLRHLIDHPGQILSREHLLRQVWTDQPYIGSRTVDVHISWLRQKLERDPRRPRHILTVRGEGYRFEP